MIRIWISLICLFGLISSFAFAEGVDFFHGSLTEAMTLAKKEKKLVFVDAYAVWCGPCKAMNRNTFPDEAVASYMNAHFVNVKLDVEKGEGPGFAQKYSITGMPTLLFLDHEGSEIHRALGYRGPKELLKEARQANSPSVNQSKLELYYNEGTSDPEILYNYAINQAEADDDYREAAGRYFATQEEKSLLNEQNWRAIQALTNEIDSREFQYLLKKQKKFSKRYGSTEVNDKIETVLRNYVVKASLLNKRSLYEEAMQVANGLKDDGLLADRLAMEYAEAMDDWGDYVYRASYYLDHHQVTDAKLLERVARNFYLHASSIGDVQKAVEWARQSTALDNAFYNNRTYAFLLEKVGRIGDARKVAYKALKIGENTGEDLADLQALVERL